MRAPFAAWRNQRQIHYRPVWVLALLFGLLIPPALWGLALLASFAFASHACYPSAAPLPGMLWQGLPGVLRIFNIACFVVGIVGIGVAAFDYRRTKNPAGPVRAGQSDPRVAATGTLSYAAILIALVLGVALLANGIEIWTIARCNLA